MKREGWLLRTGFNIAPVSLTWLLWALRSFRRVTLHYITCEVFTCKYITISFSKKERKKERKKEGKKERSLISTQPAYQYKESRLQGCFLWQLLPEGRCTVHS